VQEDLKRRVGDVKNERRVDCFGPLGRNPLEVVARLWREWDLQVEYARTGEGNLVCGGGGESTDPRRRQIAGLCSRVPEGLWLEMSVWSRLEMQVSRDCGQTARDQFNQDRENT
jgi:hypothetical protein